MPKKYIIFAINEKQKADLKDISEKLGLNITTFCRETIFKRIREENFLIKKQNCEEALIN